MSRKRTIMLTIIGIFILLTVVLFISYAYYSGMVDINNTANVNTTLGNAANYTFIANETDDIILNVNYSNMIKSKAGTAAASNIVSMNVSLSSNDNIQMYCSYDLVWVWDEAQDENNQYIISPGGINEYTVSGTNEDLLFGPTQVNNYNNTTKLYTGFIQSTSSTPTIGNWNFVVNFNNLNVDQLSHQGANYVSNIRVQNVLCNYGFPSYDAEVIAYTYKNFANNTFASKILLDNGGSPAIEAKGDPDFTKTAPVLTFVDGEFDEQKNYSPNTNYYFTYANSYYLDPLTGLYSLKNDDGSGDLTEINIEDNVVKYSEGYSSLVGNYVVYLYGQNTNSIYTYTNRAIVYKIIEATPTMIKYQSILPVVSSIDNSKDGMYATDDDYTEITGRKSYYYRGAVDNNWVSFAGYYWRIIRINGDGSIRMIYSGSTSPTQETKSVMTGTGTQLPNTIAFNSATPPSAEYVGWKYTVGENHGYANSSTIKGDDSSPAVGSLDEWYYSNIASNSTYSSKINPNQILCNDRTAYVNQIGTILASGTGTSTQFFGSYIRNAIYHQPSLVCPDMGDKFTVNGVASGNESLIYPVGLITADEMSMAGIIVYTKKNPNNYLYTSQTNWTASPHSSNYGVINLFFLYGEGRLGGAPNTTLLGVRPVISLKSDISVTGTGQWNDPYVVQ